MTSVCFEMRSWRGIHRRLYVSQLSLLFCARVHQRLREKTTDSLYLTVEQVHEAACAWLEAQRFPPRSRAAVYQKAADLIAYYQHRNQGARKAHRRATLRRLHQMGVKLSCLNRCVPHDL